MCEFFVPHLEAADWQRLWPDWQTTASILMKALAAKGLLHQAFFSLVLTDDAAIQDLNRQYRGKDQPTNVLSFPDGTPDPDSGQTYLGDVILALETIQGEAATQGKPFSAHAQHMLVHGVLHLLGYTHDEDEDAARMERLEQSVLAAVGLPDPYVC